MNLRDLIGVLGHELRTPLAAILGYQELLADGIYGHLDDRMEEPVARIQQSAQQLLYLIDGLQELATPGKPDNDEISTADTHQLLHQITSSVRPFAAGRSVTLESDLEPTETIVGLPINRLLRAADLALIAAIKNSAGRSLDLTLTQRDGNALFTIDGTGLDRDADDPNSLFAPLESDQKVSAARLRLAMATATLAVARGSLLLSTTPAGTRVALSVPLVAGRAEMN